MRATKRRRPEADLHKAVAQYLNLALPKNCWWSAIGHGGGGKIRGAQLKAMGLARGVPDIMIVPPEGDFSWRIIWIELKSKIGVLSAEQKATHKILSDLGCLVLVARSVSDVFDGLTNTIKLRARP